MLRNIVLGNKSLQKFWWLLYKVALKGLNFNRGHVPSANGEISAIKNSINSVTDQAIIIFDVGANRGQYLEMVEKTIKKEFTIYCFEPQKAAFDSLKMVAKNYANVNIENFGMGSAEGEVIMYKDSEASEYSSIYPANYTQYNIELIHKEQVKLNTIDNYCLQKGINKINFLKLDVEGHEIEVLRGASKMIQAKKITFIQFEFGLACIESRTFFKDFVNMLSNYDLYRILPSNLEPIVYSEYHELFFCTNFLAILKNK